MPRQTKYETEIYEKVQFNGKVYMYTSHRWGVLYPVVDIIRLFRPNTIIAHKIGMGQDIIRTYGSQYGHRVLETDLKNKNDYLLSLKMVKCIFLYTDGADHVVSSLMNLGKKNKIPVVCYSSIDNIYHFYDTEWEKVLFKSASDVIDNMYNLFDLEKVKKLAELFPDFEILETPEPETLPGKSKLEKCREILKENQNAEQKKKESTSVKVYKKQEVIAEVIPPEKVGTNFLSKFLNKK
jgi:hypothetical protein